MGGVIPQAVGLGPLELPAELQLERGDAVAQEDQVPAPVLHGQLPLGRESQGLPVKGDAARQVQNPDAGMAQCGHGKVPPCVR